MSDLSITASAVKPYTAGAGYRSLGVRIAAEALTAGQSVYAYSSTEVKLAKANGTALEAVLMGIAMQSVASGQSVEIGAGKIVINAAALAGKVYTLSSTFGGIAPASDLDSGWATVVVGFGALTTLLDVQPLNTGYALAISEPTVTTPTKASVMSTTATLGGNATDDNGATITERGVVYSITGTNANPEIGGSGVTKVTTTGTTGVFTVPVTGLTGSTGYSYKAYATNSEGTGYTNADTFTTS